MPDNQGMLLIIILILLLCSTGGSFYTGNHGLGGGLGVILFIVLIAYLMGWRL